VRGAEYEIFPDLFGYNAHRGRATPWRSQEQWRSHSYLRVVIKTGLTMMPRGKAKGIVDGHALAMFLQMPARF